MDVLSPHRSDAAEPVLHVTNGDCAAKRIASAGLAGEVLPWRDVLNEGPVPAALDDAELRARRAGFLAGPEPAGARRVLRDLEERDSRLAVASRDEIVLWFEPDLYDQLQLLQVLDRLSRDDLAGIPVTAVESVERMGDLTRPEARELHANRRPIPARARTLAANAWRQFRDPDPTGLEILASGATPELPHLGGAVYRHLEELPATHDGLSRSERQALEALAAGPLTARAAFVAAHHAREELVFLGDTVFFDYLERLAAGERPLVSLSRRPANEAATAQLTDDGRDVLDGKLDWIDLGGSDRWLGGVHLAGQNARWRWDADERRVRRVRLRGPGR